MYNKETETLTLGSSVCDVHINVFLFKYAWLGTKGNLIL